MDIQCSDAADQSGCRHCANALGVKRARIKTPCLVRYFKTGLPQAGGAGNVGYQSPLMIMICDAENDGGTHLLRHAEIDQPNVTSRYFGSRH